MDTINKIAKKFNLKVVEDSAQADGAAYIRKEMWHFRRCNGIETAIHYPIPIHLQEAYEDFGYKEGDFPIAEKMADEILSLPL
ncbi:MAG: hypothetical protein E4G71_04965 [Candidatus Atribacteria bacterium]|nr:MAG: hypothetical protein E4G71_04965 [Candidatus Atribacteria bacterium]